MFRSLVRLTSGVELGIMAITAFIGAGFAALVNVAVEGDLRLAVGGFIVAATLVLIGYTIAGIWRRYQRLRNGRCGHPVCHGTVSGREGLPEHLVECSNCRRVWPRIAAPQVEATAG